jgi:4,5-DOPA dioxygenase extradiol
MAALPTVFLSHGSPMHALHPGRAGAVWAALGERIGKPRAVLVASAHWESEWPMLTTATRPETIHDFGGFPDALYRVEYPAPGDVALARRAVALVGERASLSDAWGLDHGTWSVLVHLRPAADWPVVQLSIDGRLPPAEHLAIGRALAPLRDEGVLIMGSGNVTHNLRHAFSAGRRGDSETPAWARSFDEDIARALERGDTAHLTRALESDAGRQAHPTPDHYLPLLYAAGASGPEDPVRFPITGFDLASLSMRAVIWG